MVSLFHPASINTLTDMHAYKIMKTKLLLCLALVLGGGLNDFNIWAQSTMTNRFSDGETVARFPKMQRVNSMLISPDGKTIATLRGENTFWHEGGKSLTLQLWSASSGDLLWTAREPAFYLCAFSPDSTRLVGVPANASLAIWNTASGKIEHRFPRQAGSFSVAYTPDGQTLVTTAPAHEFGFGMISGPEEIRLWNGRTGRFIRVLKAQTNAISAMAISPDGRMLAMASEDTGISGACHKVNVLDMEKDSICRTFRFDTNVWTITSLAFSPDGKTLAAGGGRHNGTGEIRFWEVTSGQLQRVLTDADLGDAEPRISMTPTIFFSPDGGTLLSVGDKQTMIWWDVATGKTVESLREDDPPREGSFTVQYVKDGLVSAALNDLEQVEVRFWNTPRE
jgi:WD40 repeat protein